jgi:hypothetical protein
MTELDPAVLVPRAGRPGLIPATGLEGLEAVRLRHERLADRLAAAVRVPDRERVEHAARVAGWRREVRTAALGDGPPPVWDARTSDAWLDGRLDAAEAVIAGIVGELVDVLREADVACAEHDVDARVSEFEAEADDGFGGAIAVTQRVLRGVDAAAAAPPWMLPLSRWWRATRHGAIAELERFVSFRREQRQAGER